MSQPLIAARGARARAEAAADRPALRVITPPSARRLRVPLPLACVVLLTLGLFGLLMTNIAVAGDAYRITDLQVQSQRLAEQQEAAQESLAERAAPQELARRAAELGMVPAPAPVHLTADEALGEPTAAVAPPEPGATQDPAPATTP
ncbi:hypothetical protein [Kineococcus terrestris]|uniref:hypothetical protein n=1 Tax=Kineococcus terrestris TaxID=2044856 RepID=UPI0034DAE5BE